MTINIIRRRIAALFDAVNPQGSFQHKLANLTDEQRAEYQRWCGAKERFDKLHAGKDKFEMLLKGEQFPILHPEVSKVLYGGVPQITVDMSEEQAADVYNNFIRERLRWPAR